MMLDWNSVVSVVTASVAVLALVLTLLQMRLSNRQNIFSKRLDVWTKTKGLIDIFAKNSNRITFDKPIIPVGSYFFILTNNAFLSEMGDALKHPLEQPYHKRLLEKLEELKVMGEEIAFLFSKKNARALSSFVLDYQSLLFALYQYQILLGEMESGRERYKWTLEDAKRNLPEEDQREVLVDAFGKLQESYDMILSKGVEAKVVKQIKLKLF